MKTIFTLLIVVVCVVSAEAAPVVNGVTGEFTHSNTVTISGTGFGTKATATPLKWETFEDGTIGANLNTTGYWTVDTDNPAGDVPQFSTTQNRHANSSQNAKFIYHQLSTPLHDVAIRNVPDFATTRKIYFDYWVYYSWADLTPGTEHQIKTGRIGSGTGSSYVYPTLIDESWNYQSGSQSHYFEARNNATVNISKEYINRYTNNAWNHIQWEVGVDDIAGTDGYYKVWLNGNQIAQDSGLNMVTNSYTFQQIWLGTYLGNAAVCPKYPEHCTSEEMVPHDMTTTLYYDDVYIDSSLQRIEIGNAATYSACTHREIQIPSAWSDTSVTISVNQGAHPNSSTRYLYVIDASGVVNTTGYEITFGAGEPANGVCGTASGGTFTSLSSGNPDLCLVGAVLSFSGTGPWTWGCNGSNGGTSTASDACSASVAARIRGSILSGAIIR